MYKVSVYIEGVELFLVFFKIVKGLFFKKFERLFLLFKNGCFVMGGRVRSCFAICVLCFKYWDVLLVYDVWSFWILRG